MNHEPIGRTAAQIVQQTEELALMLMREVYQREPTGQAAPATRDSADPRAKHCWQMACKAQSLLTATDPEDALSELDDEEPWDAAQLDGIAAAIREHCGPATAARVRRILAA